VDAAEVTLDDSRIRRAVAWRPVRRASDSALVRAAQGGSERAVEELFARHWPDAYRTALLIAHDRAAAEDIAQEAFLAALRALPRFDRSRPLRPWLHRIVVNRAIDWARARRLRQEVGVDSVPEPAAPAPDLGLGEIGAAIARLSPEHRAVVVMRYLLEFTPGEIAQMLDLPRGTVNSRLRRGLDALGEVLE
jgi:RNA polymerase sigma-70 factor, ECF subfamily